MKKIGDTTIKKLINITNSESGLKDILEKGRLDFDVRNFKDIAAHFIGESHLKISCTDWEPASTNL